ncbi:C-C motif chemokine 5-like isoform X3 [Brienomyrus brachyistius]|uniref:C-C motif chemokine 5-like isoform X3 n=1 Tax=Brienomyrus brachyistius TaxID=42636 RepID=UPI0020B29A4F|nr:C-C motif chemokine 5-like isoform X3 [Brienomyrus brachyistius]
MKTLSAVLFLVLLCSVQLVYSNTPGLSVPCCVNYYNKRIPLSQIVSFSVTSSSCPKRALVFVTNRNRSFCVNPEKAWVSNHVRKLDNSKNTEEQQHPQKQLRPSITAPTSSLTLKD